MIGLLIDMMTDMYSLMAIESFETKADSAVAPQSVIHTCIKISDRCLKNAMDYFDIIKLS